MERPRSLLHLMAMKEALKLIGDHTKGLNFDEFRSRKIVRDATIRNLEILSEASRHVPPHLKQAYDTIPWRKVPALGNLLRHRYWEADPVILWSIFVDDLPVPGSALESMIANWSE